MAIGQNDDVADGLGPNLKDWRQFCSSEVPGRGTAPLVLRRSPE
jgi:hypothetical protein